MKPTEIENISHFVEQVSDIINNTRKHISDRNYGLAMDELSKHIDPVVILANVDILPSDTSGDISEFEKGIICTLCACGVPLESAEKTAKNEASALLTLARRQIVRDIDVEALVAKDCPGRVVSCSDYRRGALGVINEILGRNSL